MRFINRKSRKGKQLVAFICRRVKLARKLCIWLLDKEAYFECEPGGTTGDVFVFTVEIKLQQEIRYWFTAHRKTGTKKAKKQ